MPLRNGLSAKGELSSLSYVLETKEKLRRARRRALAGDAFRSKRINIQIGDWIILTTSLIRAHTLGWKDALGESYTRLAGHTLLGGVAA